MKKPRVFGFRFLALAIWGGANRLIHDDSWSKHLLFIFLYVLVCGLIDVAYRGWKTSNADTTGDA